MKITIETLPHDKQRYAALGSSTCGDWYFEPDGELKIFVSETGDDRMNFLVGLHEAIEATLCQHRGIKEEDVLLFDLAHSDLDDPGHSKSAVYHWEHVFSEAIERLVAIELDVNWAEYGERLDAL